MSTQDVVIERARVTRGSDHADDNRWEKATSPTDAGSTDEQPGCEEPEIVIDGVAARAVLGSRRSSVEVDTSPAPRSALGRIARSVNYDLYRAVLKRCVDLLGGSVLLLLLSPVFAAAWLAVRLTSRGPAVFAQERVGVEGRPITIHKFRSMYADHTRRIDMTEIERGETEGKVYKSDDDPRVTPVGWFLRKYSIDELPQLWDVVLARMSLVGPRPLVPHMLAPYPVIKEHRSRVRPGITGLWQVRARTDNTSVLGMVKHDYEYVDHYCLVMDLSILIRTPLVTLQTSGAQ